MVWFPCYFYTYILQNSKIAPLIHLSSAETSFKPPLWGSAGICIKTVVTKVCRKLILDKCIISWLQRIRNIRALLVAHTIKNLPVMHETQVLSLSGEDFLEKEMATHSSTLAWRIPWTEEIARLQSMGSQESDTTEQLNTAHLVNSYWAALTHQALF